MAQHAVDLQVAFPILTKMVEIAEEMPQEVRPNAAGLLERGQIMAGVMLMQAHGSKVPARAIPSVGDLQDFRHAANLAAGSVQLADPEWMASHMADLPPYDKRLVASMLMWSANATRNL